MSQYYDLQDFRLWVEGTNQVVHWEAPDLDIYQLDPTQAVPGEWLVTSNREGQPIMAFLSEPGSDGTLVLSLEGAITNRAILVHHEDDFPRKYYYSTDAGNNNVLEQRAFVLRAEGVEGSPIARNAGLRVLCLRDKSFPFASAQRQGPGIRTEATEYGPIDGFRHVDVDLKQERTALVTLTMPDTWNNVQGKENWFAITVDGTMVAQGAMTSAAPRARVPVSVAAVVPLAAGKHTIIPEWKVSGGRGRVGREGTSTLTVQLY